MGGRSRPMIELLTKLDRASGVPYPVLIVGESGVGKELCARAIHRHSARRGRPFVVENCASIPVALIEAELFGSLPGAYTGATRRRAGLLEAADGGTLFLDEIGDMSTAMRLESHKVHALHWVSPPA